MEEPVYLVDQRNRCVKVAAGKITGRPNLENFHNTPVAEGWYRVWITEVYHPQTTIQWPDESESIFKLNQVLNMNTLWGSGYLVRRDEEHMWNIGP